MRLGRQLPLQRRVQHHEYTSNVGNSMKNRASSHLFIILLMVGLQIAGYTAINRSEARAAKTDAMRTRYIMENYDPAKKQMMGLPPTPAQPIELESLPRKES